jgi:hypothetical protein
MTETVTDDSSSEEVAASLEAAVTYQCASGELLFVAAHFPLILIESIVFSFQALSRHPTKEKHVHRSKKTRVP